MSGTKLMYLPDEAQDRLLDLFADGLTDKEIAEISAQDEVLPRLSASQVREIRRSASVIIGEYIERKAKDIINRTPRAKKPYRIVELDRMMQLIYEAFPEVLAESPSHAARLMEAYLKASHQMAQETGDLSRDLSQPNKILIFLQQAPPERRARVVELLQEVEKEIRALRDNNEIMEGEFSVESE